MQRHHNAYEIIYVEVCVSGGEMTLFLFRGLALWGVFYDLLMCPV